MKTLSGSWFARSWSMLARRPAPAEPPQSVARSTIADSRGDTEWRVTCDPNNPPDGQVMRHADSDADDYECRLHFRLDPSRSDRLFIESIATETHHGGGHGERMLRELMSRYPRRTTWTMGTPLTPDGLGFFQAMRHRIHAFGVSHLLDEHGRPI